MPLAGDRASGADSGQAEGRRNKISGAESRFAGGGRVDSEHHQRSGHQGETGGGRGACEEFHCVCCVLLWSILSQQRLVCDLRLECFGLEATFELAGAVQ